MVKLGVLIPTYCDVYWIQIDVIKFFSDLRHVGCFHRVLVSSRIYAIFSRWILKIEELSASNTTFNKYFRYITFVGFIDWGTGVPCENNQHVASHWKIWSHQFVSSIKNSSTKNCVNSGRNNFMQEVIILSLVYLYQNLLSECLLFIY
jgi:hypothetical protein